VTINIKQDVNKVIFMAAKTVRDEEGRNPLVTFVVTAEEMAGLDKVADYYGVTNAQVARGLLRLSFAKLSVEGSLPAVRAGKMVSEE
jgi:hypothetical protein